jgi:electron transfer flavoprotein alpha subunit
VSGVLVWSDRDELARQLLEFAAAHRRQLGEPWAAVLGEQAAGRAQAYRSSGAARIYAGEALETTDEAISGALASLAENLGADLLLLGATRRGRSIAPRLAQLLDAGCVSEAVELRVADGELLTSRFALGGNTRAQERILTARKVIAVVPGAAGAGDQGGRRDTHAEVLPWPAQPPASRAKIVRREPKPAASANLAESERVVCVGRGLERAEDLPLIQELASAMGAELACTRPLSYEYGWLPEERMLGISGARSSPRLMLSLGVSGQVQHTVGIMGARVIVAVNRDASAQIFKLADYGIVGDLYQVVPRLTERLRERAQR